MSKVMQLSKGKNRETIKKFTPSKKLQIAAEISDLCMELKKAGKKARKHVPFSKP